MMCGNEWCVIAAFVAGLIAGCTGTAWCIRFGLKAAYAVKHDTPSLPDSQPEPEDDIEAEMKMLERRDGKR